MAGFTRETALDGRVLDGEKMCANAALGDSRSRRAYACSCMCTLPR